MAKVSNLLTSKSIVKINKAKSMKKYSNSNCWKLSHPYNFFIFIYFSDKHTIFSQQRYIVEAPTKLGYFNNVSQNDLFVKKNSAEINYM